MNKLDEFITSLENTVLLLSGSDEGMLALIVIFLFGLVVGALMMTILHELF